VNPNKATSKKSGPLPRVYFLYALGEVRIRKRGREVVVLHMSGDGVSLWMWGCQPYFIYLWSMFLMRVDTLRRQMLGGWALEIESFFGPCEMDP
jgi:hypothetical protein